MTTTVNTVITEAQIEALFEALMGVPARRADVLALQAMAPEGVTVHDFAEYLWDHWMSEPDDLPVEDVAGMVIGFLTDNA